MSVNQIGSYVSNSLTILVNEICCSIVVTIINNNKLVSGTSLCNKTFYRLSKITRSFKSDYPNCYIHGDCTYSTDFIK